MHARKLRGELDVPNGAAWRDAKTTTVALRPVALDAQPTEYIRVAWADRRYGTVPEVRVAAAHDGARLYVRLDWAADGEAGAADGEASTEFADAAGVYFAAAATTPAATIGAPDAPARLWYWQADLPAARRLDASGPGVFRPDGDGVSAAAVLENGRWAVVLAGDLADAAATGGIGGIGVAVWNGANEERAGLGAVSADWEPLDIE